MCRESAVKIQGYIAQLVAQQCGRIWVTTEKNLRELLLEEFPDLKGKAALDHPRLGLSQVGIRSGLFHTDCSEVIIFFDLERDDSLDGLRHTAEENGLSECVQIALMEAGVEVVSA